MKRSVVFGALLIASFGWLPVRAQDYEGEPGRGVARISVINGDVSVRRGDSGDLVAAALDVPLVVGDWVVTAPGSRAEVQFDYGDLIRVAQDAEIRLSELDAQHYQIQIARGTVTFRVLRDYKADTELSTPSVAVRPLRRGVYRITVGDDGSSEISVRSGEAEIVSPQGSTRLGAGRTVLARGDASNPEYQEIAPIAKDDWDLWNESRDHELESSHAYSYVSRDISGAEELDANGRWVYYPDYGGYVWAPTVPGDWAPYRNGRWVWVDYYGWTWVSYDPWGWAPYHYGRWFYGGSYGWCWWPGPMNRRHYWSPALVAFFGFGGGVGGVGFGFGRVGWVPLAPFEPYYPWYGRHYYGGLRGGVNGVNIVGNINIANVYRNARVNNGVSVVGSGEFGRGGRYTGIGSAELSRANVMKGQLPMSPSRESLRWSDRQPSSSVQSRVARDAAGDRFYSRRTPAQVDRVPFSQQQQAMDQVARRTFGDIPGRAAAGGSTSQPLNRTTEGTSGWRRFGSPNPSSQAGGGGAAAVDRAATRQQDAGGGNSTSGWRRFGEPSGNAERANPSSTGGWDRFGTNPSTPRSQPSSAPGSRYSAAPQRAESVGYSTSRAPVHISAPVARESAPRSGGGGGGQSHGGGGGGGGSRSGGGGGGNGGGHGSHR